MKCSLKCSANLNIFVQQKKNNEIVSLACIHERVPTAIMES